MWEKFIDIGSVITEAAPFHSVMAYIWGVEV
jgi:hypothetical protein